LPLPSEGEEDEIEISPQKDEEEELIEEVGTLDLILITFIM
jgi:hypothetical protein